MAQPLISVQVRGLRELRAALRQADRDLPKQLTLVFREAAQLVQARAQAAAPSDRHARSVRARGTQKGAFLRVVPGRRGDSLAVFLGQRRRSGWYARGRYRPSAGRQFRPWVGNAWDPGGNAGVPYFIGPAVNQSVDEVVDLIGDRFEDLLRQAFPN